MAIHKSLHTDMWFSLSLVSHIQGLMTVDATCVKSILWMRGGLAVKLIFIVHFWEPCFTTLVELSPTFKAEADKIGKFCWVFWSVQKDSTAIYIESLEFTFQLHARCWLVPHGFCFLLACFDESLGVATSFTTSSMTRSGWRSLLNSHFLLANRWGVYIGFSIECMLSSGNSLQKHFQFRLGELDWTLHFKFGFAVASIGPSLSKFHIYKKEDSPKSNYHRNSKESVISDICICWDLVKSNMAALTQTLR